MTTEDNTQEPQPEPPNGLDNVMEVIYKGMTNHINVDSLEKVDDLCNRIGEAFPDLKDSYGMSVFADMLKQGYYENHPESKPDNL